MTKMKNSEEKKPYQGTGSFCYVCKRVNYLIWGEDARWALLSVDCQTQRYSETEMYGSSKNFHPQPPERQVCEI